VFRTLRVETYCLRLRHCDLCTQRVLAVAMVVAVRTVVVVELAVDVLLGLGVVVVAGLAEVVPAECELELQASAVTASTATIVISKSHRRLLCMIRTPPKRTQPLGFGARCSERTVALAKAAACTPYHADWHHYL
jgi:hypothetical protein